MAEKFKDNFKLTAEQRLEQTDRLTRLAAAAGYEWRRGMHPEDEIATLTLMFLELVKYKRQIVIAAANPGEL